ncbi:hypothetical protein [Klebsiella aerogenes]|uniref:hypothetical protein n=1 Tax=Klebsiella aerogenes TaxID=548 RepID=UPI000A494220|nr:hypothetical protein [Klebsiella aerogenes]
MLQDYVSEHSSLITKPRGLSLGAIAYTNNYTVLDSDIHLSEDSAFFTGTPTGTVPVAGGNVGFAYFVQASGVRRIDDRLYDTVFSSAGSLTMVGVQRCNLYLARYEGTSVPANILSTTNAQLFPVPANFTVVNSGTDAATAISTLSWCDCTSFDVAPYIEGNTVFFGVMVQTIDPWSDINGVISLRTNFQERIPLQPLKA